MSHRMLASLALAALPSIAWPQGNDEAYTRKIREYTTDPMFLTELVDHLPASAKPADPVKTPEKKPTL